MTIWANTGSWREIKALWAKTGTTWRSIQNAWAKTGTTWRKVFQAVSIVLTNRYISQLDPGGGTAGVELQSSGQLRELRGVTYTSVSGEWMDPLGAVPGSSYDVRAQLTGDALNASDDTGVWLNLGVDREWKLVAGSGQSKSCDLDIDIRDAGTLSIVASATIQLGAGDLSS